MVNLIPVQAGGKSRDSPSYDLFYGPLSCFANEMAQTGAGTKPISDKRNMPTWGIGAYKIKSEKAEQLAREGGAYKPEELEKLPEYKTLTGKMDNLEKVIKGLKTYTEKSNADIYSYLTYQFLNEKPDSFDAILKYISSLEPVKKKRTKGTSAKARKANVVPEDCASADIDAYSTIFLYGPKRDLLRESQEFMLPEYTGKYLLGGPKTYLLNEPKGFMLS